ncbi:copper resistance system multicopper oxidase [Acinetobacter gerneri]|uniref:copper resistance system multicopper oxidase n=1 Tax=Acinetobacter gerneri TaxID=202952 RepID=UPI0028AF39C5|nr:copper resistance system multicopper oxidase [Acinetobacter gerneri]
MSTRLIQSLFVGACLLSSNLVFAKVTEYHLNIAENTVNITGKPLKRITVNGQFPAPLLEFEEGDDAVIYVHNNLKNQDSSVHWHGLLLPGIMDGVPGFNGFNGIKPQQDFVYRFKVRQSGTYWYHAHSKGQEQDGLYGALVIYPKDKKPIVAAEKTDRDYVVMLSDFHESSSDQIMKNLKKDAEYYQNKRETIGDVFTQIKNQGLKSTWQDRRMWNQMRMLKTDLSDVSGYTFLVNGKTPEQNWLGNFKAGEKVRLRFINASAMSFFDVRIPNLKMTVVSADGQAVQPVPVDEFRIGTAETYDVIVEPKQENYQIQAESIDRTGFALATLHQENTPIAKFPEPQARPRALLTMQDMGMDHASHQDMQMNPSSAPMSNQPSMATADHDHMMMTEQHHQQMSMSDHMAKQEDPETKTKLQSNKENSAKTVQGWANAATPTGDKALTYQDLKSLKPQQDTREPSSELVINLGGTMERYIWTINGKKFNEAEPLKVKYGERIRLKFVNNSMMAHPMHLHGMFMQLENGQPSEYMPNKHTIVVPPGKTVTALLTADELGEWAIHCHLLYHMSAGMMNKLIVANVANGNLSTALISQQATPDSTEEGAEHAHH